MAASGINWCIATRSRYCTLADHSIRPSSSSVPEGSSTSVDPSLDHPTPPTPVRPSVPRGPGSLLSVRARSALFALCLDNPPAPAAVSSPRRTAFPSVVLVCLRRTSSGQSTRRGRGPDTQRVIGVVRGGARSDQVWTCGPDRAAPGGVQRRADESVPWSPPPAGGPPPHRPRAACAGEQASFVKSNRSLRSIAPAPRRRHLTEHIRPQGDKRGNKRDPPGKSS